MKKLNIVAEKTALLVMDCQNGIVASLTPAESQKVVTSLSKVIEASRKANIQIVYVVVRFREGYPEVSSRNALFQGIKEAGRLKEGAPDADICDQIRPQLGDLIVTKKRISAFTGSDLEQIIRSKGIETLVLTGVSSLGVVESTARSAVDMDYRIIVLEDCCSDRDPDAHQIAMKWFLPRISTVCSSEELLKALG